MPTPDPPNHPTKRALFIVIFEARTPAGRAFDIGLIAVILASVIVVMLESVPRMGEDYGILLDRLEWAFTLAFTVEYLARLWVVRRPRQYATSFFGVIDLLAILPTYLALVFPGAQVFLVIRLARILRVFHVFGLSQAERAASVLLAALRESRHAITVFLFALATLVVLLGALLYMVERGTDSAFTSIPVGVYWAVVTITTLGYGDIVPVTGLGRGITTGIVVLGYWVLAVPVGIISAALVNAARRDEKLAEAVSCPECGAGGHTPDARFCRVCGALLGGAESDEPRPA